MIARAWNRRTTRAVAVALGALLVAGSSAAADPIGVATAVGSPRPEIIDPQLRAEATVAAQAGERVEYLVSLAAAPDLAPLAFDRAAVVAVLKETAERTQVAVVEQLRADGQQVLSTFWLANLVLARSTPESMMALTALPGVEAVRPVQELAVPEPEIAPLMSQPVGGRIQSSTTQSSTTQPSTTWGIDRIGAHRVWDELGFDGSGVRVATLDTGVDIAHPDLAGAMVTDDPSDPTYPGGWMQFDVAGNPVVSEPHDTQWHGTHVSGTIHGGDRFQSGTAIGVAPGANMMHALVLPGGTATIPQAIAGMQWAVEPFDHEGNPAGQPAHVVNMSFGPRNGGIEDNLAEPIRNMYLAGVVPVASAGNCGDGCHGSPANVFEAFAVGATDVDDNIADFSSGGEVQRGQWSNPPADWPSSWMVPDVSAPGVDVISSVPPGTFPDEPDRIYGTARGTSMAAPHVAATAALMLSSDSGLGVDDIAGTLTATSFFDDRHGPERPNSRFGHGRIDAYGAVSQVALDSGVAGEVIEDRGRVPIAAARVEVVEAGWSTTTDADGRYGLRLHPGTYTLTFSAFGYDDRTVQHVEVRADRMTTVDARLARRPTGSITGTVVLAESGHGVPGVPVALDGTPLPTVTTDNNGAFTISGVPSGSYRVSAAPATFRPPPAQQVSVEDGTHVAVDFTIECAPECFADELWVARHGAAGDGFNRALAMGVSQNGQAVYVTGDSAGTDGSVDFATVAHDGATGAELWAARYNGPGTGSDTPSALEVSPDGQAVYVTGHSGGIGSGLDYATVAYDAATGDELWAARYDGPGSNLDIATDLAVSGDGTVVYVTGRSRSGTALASEDYATVAYDSATGNQLWVARYGATEQAHDGAWALAVSPDDTTVYVTGQSQSGADFTSIGFATVAYDATTGDELWLARFHEGATAVARAVSVSPDGSAVYVTGDSHASNAGSDYVTVAYDTAGDELWLARHEPPAAEFAVPRAVAVAPDGAAVFVTGHSRLGFPNLTATDYTTTAYDATTGEELWMAGYPATGAPLDTAPSLGVGRDGTAVYLGGHRQFEPGGPIGRATVAYEAATGRQRWVGRYDGAGNGAEQSRALAVSADAVYVTGPSPKEGAGTEFATVAYSADVRDTFAAFVPWDLRIDPSPVLRGVPVTVEAAITNVGTAAGTYQASLLLSDQEVDRSSITLGSGATGRLSWQLTRDQLGVFDVQIGQLAGELQVVEASYGYLRQRIDTFRTDGDVTHPGAARLLATLHRAERHVDRGHSALAVTTLEAFRAVAADEQFVPGEAARHELTIGAAELIAAAS